jgi:signal transduction histidine kinase
MSDEPSRQSEALHELNNQLTVIIGFSELLLESTPENDPRRADVIEIRNAARAALSIAPKLG